MKIHILFGQRNESYEGEYAPEVLLAWDEPSIDENPDEFEAEIVRVMKKNEGEMMAMRVVATEVNADKIRQIRVGRPVLKGKVGE